MEKGSVLIGMFLMFIYMIVGILVLLVKCTDAYGKGKAEVRDIILWQLMWPLPVTVAFIRGCVTIGRNMLDALPKRKNKEEPKE